MRTFREYLAEQRKLKESGVPFVGQAPDPGGEMSWQGAAGGGKLHSAKGDIPVKKHKKHKKHHHPGEGT
jgi:hypothetical protein